MHGAVTGYVSEWATGEPLAVLDIGGRDLNGSCRHLFPNADYTVLDLRPGAGVDVVADATTWTPDRSYDLVVCVEVFEHLQAWSAICWTAFKALRPGGRLIVTCAGPGRPSHSGIQATGLMAGEWYENIAPGSLREQLADAGFVDIECHQAGHDVQATALRPEGLT